MGRGDTGFADDDRLPWLESVEPDYEERPPVRRTLLFVLIAVAVIAAAAFAFYWFQTHPARSGNGELIEAQEGDYKVKPETPGGMEVEGEGDSMFATSAGEAPVAPVAMGAQPEDPVEGTVAKAPPAPAASGSARVTLPVPQATSAVNSGRSGGASVVQLGAFPSRAGAIGAWQSLSGRYDYLASLGHSIEQTQRDGTTFHRLRVNAGSAGNARALCDRLKGAGENCYVTN